MDLCLIGSPPISRFAWDHIQALPSDLIASWTTRQKKLILEAFFQLDMATGGGKAPRVEQLKGMIAVLERRDLIVRARTGFGKTLFMVLALLVKRDGIAITATPLKLMQKKHVAEFESYGIRSAMINSDTPHDSVIWKDIANGSIRHILVAPEQLGSEGGHITRFAKLTWDLTFLKRVFVFNIDEAHFIQNVGLPHGQNPAFRPAWGRLYDLCIRLPLGVPRALFSASLAPAVIQTLKENMRISSNAEMLMLSINRPNITQAILPLIGSIKNYSNLNFLVPRPYHPPMPPMKKGIIFLDDKLATSALAEYLNARLSEPYRATRPFRHFHSGMSNQYLDETYAEFEKPDGLVKVLVSTCAAAVGVDIRDAEFIICFGVPEGNEMKEQKEGRGGRDGSTECIDVVFAEDWALDEDPERDRKKGCAKEKRTPISLLRELVTKECRRLYNARRNNDQTPEALLYTNRFCCDNHNDGFNINDYFLAPVIPLDHGTESTPEPKRPRAKYRAVPDRNGLETALVEWRDNLHAKNAQLRQWPSEWILDDPSIVLLARAVPKHFKVSSEVRVFLSESEEWGTLYALDVFSVIVGYDMALEARRKAEKERAKAEAKLQRAEARKEKWRLALEEAARTAVEVAEGEVSDDGEAAQSSGDDNEGVESEDEQVASQSDDDNLPEALVLPDPCRAGAVTRRLAIALHTFSRTSAPSSPASTPTSSRPCTPRSPPISSSLRRPRPQASPKSSAPKSPPQKRIRSALTSTTNTYSLRSRVG